jgi:hypothetical protein
MVVVIYVMFEIKVFLLLLKQTEYLISTVGGEFSPEYKAASTLATVWTSQRH